MPALGSSCAPAPARPPRRDDGPAIDPFTAERVLNGTASAKGIPAPYRRVMVELRAAASLPRPVDLAGEEAAIAGYRDAHADRPGRRRRRRRRTLALLVAAATVLVAGGTAAAGSLPSTAQQRVSDALAYVGIAVPSDDNSDPDPGIPARPARPVADTVVTAPVHSAPADAPPPTPPAAKTDPPAAPTPSQGSPSGEATPGETTTGETTPDETSSKHPLGAPPGATKKAANEPGN